MNKWNKDGSIVWNKTEIFDGVSSSRQGLLVYDDYLYTSFNAGNGTLAKWDLEGNIIWNVTWSLDGHISRFFDLTINNNNIYIIGLREAFESDETVYWLLKFEIPSSGIPGSPIYLILIVSVVASFVYFKKQKKYLTI